MRVEPPTSTTSWICCALFFASASALRVGSSVRRVYDLARLYDEITPHAAARMALIWRGTRARGRPPHVPVHWDDEPQSARALALPAPRRVVRGREARAAKVQPNGR